MLYEVITVGFALQNITLLPGSSPSLELLDFVGKCGTTYTEYDEYLYGTYVVTGSEAESAPRSARVARLATAAGWPVVLLEQPGKDAFPVYGTLQGNNLHAR